MSNTVILLMVTMVPVIAGTDEQNALWKRSVPTNSYLDHLANFNDYPVLVSKRAALLLDQLMIALQDALNNQPRRELQKGNRISMRSSTPHLPAENLSFLPLAQAQTMDLRQQKQGHLYWRCFLNIVTCYKKK
ncbi:uncharacterized protein LOC122530253 [Frieseomelitta varia]|uniref:uncharacterized protein LOC122530253 n=1 Tax=Frieseomelitta varia TaxID=561572 RepID=UPI001CB695BB|nr:uncharacterized protein LOC122530253 [Frieseomelitta varia]